MNMRELRIAPTLALSVGLLVLTAVALDRKGEQSTEHLKDYTGWMHADGYSGFNKLYRAGRVREVACIQPVSTICPLALRCARSVTDWIISQAERLHRTVTVHKSKPRLVRIGLPSP